MYVHCSMDSGGHVAKVLERLGPPQTEDLIGLYATMVTIRKFEDTVRRLHLADKAPGLVHLCTGQEAVPTGAIATLEIDDSIAVYHRSHGHFIAKGSKMDEVLAELLHRKSGLGIGRAGEAHLCDAATNNLGSSGIVGGTIPIATGAALAAKLSGSNQIVASFFGDGVLNQGVMFEALNMAAIWSLPIVYICENNRYGEFTESVTVTAGAKYSDRGAVFGMPTEDVDGMDVLAVYEAVSRAVTRARNGKGPSFLVCETDRFTGHHVSDKQEYKDSARAREWEKRDPIPNFANWLIKEKHADADSLAAVDQQAEEEVAAAAEKALASPEPTEEDLMSFVYA